MTRSVQQEKMILTLDDVGCRIQNLQQEVANLKRRVRDLMVQNAKSQKQNQGWLAQIALDEERCEVVDIARSLAGEMEKVSEILENKQAQAFKEYDRYILLSEQLKKRLDIANQILEMMQRGVSAGEIDGKLGRTYGGDYKWRAIVGNCLLADIHTYFKNPGSADAKEMLCIALQKVKSDIAPELHEDERKFHKLQNLEQMLQRITKLREDLTLIPAYAAEVCHMQLAIKEVQTKMGNMFP